LCKARHKKTATAVAVFLLLMKQAVLFEPLHQPVPLLSGFAYLAFWL
jgi:hypothetical protein